VKKAILLAVAVLFVAGSAIAAGPISYIGLFKDINHNMTTPPLGNSVCTTASFYCWIWCLPSDRGMYGADFCLTKPTSAEGEIPVIDIIVQIATINPGITAPLGDLWSGMSVTFSTCQMDWIWLYNLRMRDYSDETPVHGMIEVVPHPGTEPLPALQLVNCNMDLEPFVYLTPLYLCPTESPLGVQETNWGAIKSLF